MSQSPQPMAVECQRCGQMWPRDSALEVPCRCCGAGVGRKCRRPSEHGAFGGEPHAERDRAAMNAGLLMKCPGVRQPKPADSAKGVEDSQLTLPTAAA